MALLKLVYNFVIVNSFLEKPKQYGTPCIHERSVKSFSKKSSLVSFNKMANASVLSDVLKYDIKIGMHQLAPLPYYDPTDLFKSIRLNLLGRMNAGSIGKYYLE